jgi:outer membrane receptor protein involved in Fe transport
MSSPPEEIKTNSLLQEESMINRNYQVARAVRHALLFGAVATTGVSLPAFAQDQQEAAPSTELGTVVVTGSRIPQPNLTSISPVTAVSSQEVKLEGVTRVEDLINNLPQAFADFGGNLSNGATGAASVNLRNLGAQRTLVLVNNRRLMPGDPTQNGNGTADLNQVPAALVERVDVLTGGASAVYGADAVAGVVNFIMNDHFEGVRFDGQYSLYQHNNNSSFGDTVAARGFALPEDNVTDGYAHDYTFVLGMNTGDGKGNATVYAGYRKLSAILQSERDFSACNLGSADTVADMPCAGSSTASPPRLQAAQQTGAAAGSETGPGLTFDATGALRPFTAADQYNFAPTNYYQRPDQRYTAGLFAHYDVNEHATAYTEFMFMNDTSVAQIAPSGLFRGGGPINGSYVVNCANPFLTAEEVTTFCTNQGLTLADDAAISIGKRNAEGGGRQDHLEHTSYRAVIGFRGDITNGWSYDAYGLYGTTKYAENYLNDFSVRRIGNALTVVNGPNGPICRVNADADISNDDAACVPYNIFQPGGVTQAALGYVSTPGFQQGETNEQILSGAITGDLGVYGVKMPWASDGLGIAVGAEYRRESSELRTDIAFQTGDLAGQGGATIGTTGAFDVREMFMEARLPIAQDKVGAQVLSAEVGYRYSDYSLGFNTDTYKFGMDWAPVEDVRLRASYQRAVRAPNIQELFRAQVVQLDGSTDPCAVDNPGVDTPQASAAACALTGVTAAQYGQIVTNPAGQYNGLTGGNPDLQPEESDTYSYGFVLTPRFLQGFSFAVDYFDIKVDGLVGGVGADLAINSCLASGDPFFCGLVHRAPGSGSLWLGSQGYVVDTNLNTGSLRTKGIDSEINYSMDLGGNGGRLSFQFIGTYVDSLVTEPLPGAPTYDCKGLYGTVCGTPVPEWRHKFRATWSTPWNLDLSLSWRYIDSVKLDASVDNVNFNQGLNFGSDQKLDSVNYLDLSAAYTFMGNITVRLGINNITDEDPPIAGTPTIAAPLGNGNTYPQVYDALGRYGFLSLTADF